MKSASGRARATSRWTVNPPRPESNTRTVGAVSARSMIAGPRSAGPQRGTPRRSGARHGEGTTGRSAPQPPDPEPSPLAPICSSPIRSNCGRQGLANGEQRKRADGVTLARLQRFTPAHVDPSIRGTRRIEKGRQMLATKMLGVVVLLTLSAGLAAAAPATVKKSTSVRQGPGTHYPVVAKLRRGAVVDVAGCARSWCQVDRGYVARSVLALGGGAPAVAVAPGYVDDYYEGPSYFGYYHDVRLGERR